MSTIRPPRGHSRAAPLPAAAKSLSREVRAGLATAAFRNLKRLDKAGSLGQAEVKRLMVNGKDLALAENRAELDRYITANEPTAHDPRSPRIHQLASGERSELRFYRVPFYDAHRIIVELSPVKSVFHWSHLHLDWPPDTARPKRLLNLGPG